MVFDVIVASDHRGRGFGARLMDLLVAHPRLAGIESIELVCQPALVPFYERWGFSATLEDLQFMRRQR